jgi:hypothetical protein
MGVSMDWFQFWSQDVRMDWLRFWGFEALIGGVLAIALTVTTLILSQRKSMSERSIRSWFVVTACAWVFTFVASCVVLMMFANGISRI